MPERVELHLHEWRGWFQVSIQLVDEEGGGHGYRIFGPKFDGTSTLLQRIPIEARDAEEIRRYLDMVGENA